MFDGTFQSDVLRTTNSENLNIDQFCQMLLWRDKNGNLMKCPDKIEHMKGELAVLLHQIDEWIMDSLLLECNTLQCQYFLNEAIRSIVERRLKNGI
jgi:hypothetical protein